MVNHLSKSATDDRQMLAGAAPGVLYRALDNVPTALYIKDREHRLVFVNKACGQLLGRSPESLNQATEADILSVAVAQRLQAVDADLWQDSHELTQPLTVTIQPAAAARCTVIRQPQRSEDGQFLICYLQPVVPTADAASNLATSGPWEMPQLQALLANVPAVIYQLHRQADGQIQFAFVSPGAYEVFGIASNAILVDAGQILSLIHSLDRPRLEHTLAESAETLSPWRWEG
ncbi:MAG: PAS domain-containing protein, partial [Cyanobacteria bacterium P01_C01_bin.70]